MLRALILVVCPDYTVPRNSVQARWGFSDAYIPLNFAWAWDYIARRRRRVDLLRVQIVVMSVGLRMILYANMAEAVVSYAIDIGALHLEEATADWV